MKPNELRKDDRVLVTRGLWIGFEGIIEDIHPESSVVRLRSEDGETAYAQKEDVKPVEGAKTTK